MAEDPQPIQSSEAVKAPYATTRNLSVIVSGIVVIVALVKAKQEDIPKIVEILVRSDTFAAVGWTLAATFLLGGVVSIRLLMISHDKANARIYKERDDLQTKLLNR
jgi:hypothetical protein